MFQDSTVRAVRREPKLPPVVPVPRVATLTEPLQRQEINSKDIALLLGVKDTQIVVRTKNNLFSHSLFDGTTICVRCVRSTKGRPRFIFDQDDFEQLRGAVAEQKEKCITVSEMIEELERRGISILPRALRRIFSSKSGAVDSTRTFEIDGNRHTMTLQTDKSAKEGAIAARYLFRNDFELFASWLKLNYTYKPKPPKEKTPAPQGFFRLEDAASAIGISLSTLIGYTKNGKCAYEIERSNGRKIIPETEVARLKEQTSVPANCVKLIECLKRIGITCYQTDVVVNDGQLFYRFEDDEGNLLNYQLYTDVHGNYWIAESDFKEIEAVEAKFKPGGCYVDHPFIADHLKIPLIQIMDAERRKIESLDLPIPGGTDFKIPLACRRHNKKWYRLERVEEYPKVCVEVASKIVYGAQVAEELGYSSPRALYANFCGEAGLDFTLNGTAYSIRWKQETNKQYYLTREEADVLAQYKKIVRPSKLEYWPLATVLRELRLESADLDGRNLILSRANHISVPLESVQRSGEIEPTFYISKDAERLFAFCSHLKCSLASTRLEAVKELAEAVPKKNYPHKKEMLQLVDEICETEHDPEILASMHSVLQAGEKILNWVEVSSLYTSRLPILGYRGSIFSVVEGKTMFRYELANGESKLFEVSTEPDGIQRISSSDFSEMQKTEARLFGSKGDYFDLEQLSVSLGSSKSHLIHKISEGVLPLSLLDVWFNLPVFQRYGKWYCERKAVAVYSETLKQKETNVCRKEQVACALGVNVNSLINFFGATPLCFNLNGVNHSLSWKKDVLGRRYLPAEDLEVLRIYHPLVYFQSGTYILLPRFLRSRGGMDAFQLENRRLILSRDFGISVPLQELNGVLYLEAKFQPLVIFRLDLNSRYASIRSEIIRSLVSAFQGDQAQFKREMFLLACERSQIEDQPEVLQEMNDLFSKTPSIPLVDYVPIDDSSETKQLVHAEVLVSQASEVSNELGAFPTYWSLAKRASTTLRAVKQSLNWEELESLQLDWVEQVQLDILFDLFASEDMVFSSKKVAIAVRERIERVVPIVEKIADTFRDEFPDLDIIERRLQRVAGENLGASGKEYFSYLQAVWLDFASASQFRDFFISGKASLVSKAVLKQAKIRLEDVVVRVLDQNKDQLPSSAFVSNLLGISQNVLVSVLGKEYFKDLQETWMEEYHIPRFLFEVHSRILSNTKPPSRPRRRLADSVTSESPYSESSSPST